MIKKMPKKCTIIIFIILFVWGCKIPSKTISIEHQSVPVSYNNLQDTTNIASVRWKEYFADPNLTILIETALKNNQELNVITEEIEIGKSEIRAKRGEYLPFVELRANAGLDKDGKYTTTEVVKDNIDVKKNKDVIESNTDYSFGAYASWEVDIWKKLHNAEKSAVLKYLSSVEGKNFMVTNLVAEIANSYYELIALDNSLRLIEKNIEIQNQVLQAMRLQKESAKVTQLAVNRFEAQLLNTQNLQYEIKQKTVETENHLNYLAGRFPQPIQRSSELFENITFDSIQPGIPSQLLNNRPDIRQAELDLEASKLDIEVARANFYPSFRIQAGIGFHAFNPSFLIHPESILYSLAGDLAAPLINRNAIQAAYNTANAKQIQSLYKYEQTILNAYIEVMNQLSKMSNYFQSFTTKSKEVELLNQSVKISNSLFQSARADYTEVLLTQREALESKMDLIEIKIKQMNAKVNIYQALGGGWR